MRKHVHIKLVYHSLPTPNTVLFQFYKAVPACVRIQTNSEYGHKTRGILFSASAIVSFSQFQSITLCSVLVQWPLFSFVRLRSGHVKYTGHGMYSGNTRAEPEKCSILSRNEI